MSPRPDRRPDSRPERGARRPEGHPLAALPVVAPPAPVHPRAVPVTAPPAGEQPPEGAGGSDRGRPSREAGRPTGEWTPRRRDGDDGPRRGEGARFGERRPQRPEFGRPEERRWERRPEQRRPEGGARFDRRPEAGRPSRPSGPRSAGATGGPRFLPRGARPRPPAELMGLERRAPGAGARAAESPEGEHFAGAAPSDLIWGRHSAQAALESGRPIHRIWCTPEMRFSPRFLQLLREAKASGVLVEEVTWARLGQISGGAVHQGIVLQPAAAETLDLPSLIDGCRTTGEAPLLIAVDGLTDPQNLGAIVRSAEALGAHGLVLPQRRNAGLTGSVAKVAAGALEHLPVARVVNLNRSLETLKDEGYRVIGLASEGSLTLEEADLDGPLVVVTGSEGDGLSLLTRRHCDQLVRIPLRGTTPSLNASVATALLLYEIARRGWMQGLRGNSPAPRLVRPALPAPAAIAEPTAEADQAAISPVTEELLPSPAVAPAGPLHEETSAWHAASGADSAASGLEGPPAEPQVSPGSDADQPMVDELVASSSDDTTSEAARGAPSSAWSATSEPWGSPWSGAAAPADAASAPAAAGRESGARPVSERDSGLSFDGDILL